MRDIFTWGRRKKAFYPNGEINWNILTPNSVKEKNGNFPQIKNDSCSSQSSSDSANNLPYFLPATKQLRPSLRCLFSSANAESERVVPPFPDSSNFSISGNNALDVGAGGAVDQQPILTTFQPDPLASRISPLGLYYGSENNLPSTSSVQLLKYENHQVQRRAGSSLSVVESSKRYSFESPMIAPPDGWSHSRSHSMSSIPQVKTSLQEYRQVLVNRPLGRKFPFNLEILKSKKSKKVEEVLVKSVAFCQSSPEEATLEEGDVILRLNALDLTTLTRRQCVKLFRDAPSSFMLLIRRSILPSGRQTQDDLLAPRDGFDQNAWCSQSRPGTQRHSVPVQHKKITRPSNPPPPPPDAYNIHLLTGTHDRLYDTPWEDISSECGLRTSPVGSSSINSTGKNLSQWSSTTSNDPHDDAEVLTSNHSFTSFRTPSQDSNTTTNTRLHYAVAVVQEPPPEWDQLTTPNHDRSWSTLKGHDELTLDLSDDGNYCDTVLVTPEKGLCPDEYRCNGEDPEQGRRENLTPFRKKFNLEVGPAMIINADTLRRRKETLIHVSPKQNNEKRHSMDGIFNEKIKKHFEEKIEKNEEKFAIFSSKEKILDLFDLQESSVDEPQTRFPSSTPSTPRSCKQVTFLLEEDGDASIFLPIRTKLMTGILGNSQEKAGNGEDRREVAFKSILKKTQTNSSCNEIDLVKLDFTEDDNKIAENFSEKNEKSTDAVKGHDDEEDTATSDGHADEYARRSSDKVDAHLDQQQQRYSMRGPLTKHQSLVPSRDSSAVPSDDRIMETSGLLKRNLNGPDQSSSCSADHLGQAAALPTSTMNFFEVDGDSLPISIPTNTSSLCTAPFTEETQITSEWNDVFLPPPENPLQESFGAFSDTPTESMAAAMKADPEELDEAWINCLKSPWPNTSVDEAKPAASDNLTAIQRRWSVPECGIFLPANEDHLDTAKSSEELNRPKFQKPKIPPKPKFLQCLLSAGIRADPPTNSSTNPSSKLSVVSRLNSSTPTVDHAVDDSEKNEKLQCDAPFIANNDTATVVAVTPADDETETSCNDVKSSQDEAETETETLSHDEAEAEASLNDETSLHDEAETSCHDKTSCFLIDLREEIVESFPLPPDDLISGSPPPSDSIISLTFDTVSPVEDKTNTMVEYATSLEWMRHSTDSGYTGDLLSVQPAALIPSPCSPLVESSPPDSLSLSISSTSDSGSELEYEGSSESSVEADSDFKEFDEKNIEILHTSWDIGIKIRLNEQQQCVIAQLTRNSRIPGVKEGDIVRSINGQTLDGALMSELQISTLFRALPRGLVRMTVRNGTCQTSSLPQDGHIETHPESSGAKMTDPFPSSSHYSSYSHQSNYGYSQQLPVQSSTIIEPVSRSEMSLHGKSAGRVGLPAEFVIKINKLAQNDVDDDKPFPMKPQKTMQSSILHYDPSRKATFDLLDEPLAPPSSYLSQRQINGERRRSYFTESSTDSQDESSLKSFRTTGTADSYKIGRDQTSDRTTAKIDPYKIGRDQASDDFKKKREKFLGIKSEDNNLSNQSKNGFHGSLGSVAYNPQSSRVSVSSRVIQTEKSVSQTDTQSSDSSSSNQWSNRPTTGKEFNIPIQRESQTSGFVDFSKNLHKNENHAPTISPTKKNGSFSGEYIVPIQREEPSTTTHVAKFEKKFTNQNLPAESNSDKKNNSGIFQNDRSATSKTQHEIAIHKEQPVTHTSAVNGTVKTGRKAPTATTTAPPVTQPYRSWQDQRGRSSSISSAGSSTSLHSFSSSDGPSKSSNSTGKEVTNAAVLESRVSSGARDRHDGWVSPAQVSRQIPGRKDLSNAPSRFSEALARYKAQTEATPEKEISTKMLERRGSKPLVVPIANKTVHDKANIFEQKASQDGGTEGKSTSSVFLSQRSRSLSQSNLPIPTSPSPRDVFQAASGRIQAKILTSPTEDHDSEMPSWTKEQPGQFPTSHVTTHDLSEQFKPAHQDELSVVRGSRDSGVSSRNSSVTYEHDLMGHNDIFPAPPMQNEKENITEPNDLVIAQVPDKTACLPLHVARDDVIAAAANPPEEVTKVRKIDTKSSVSGSESKIPVAVLEEKSRFSGSEPKSSVANLESKAPVAVLESKTAVAFPEKKSSVSGLEENQQESIRSAKVSKMTEKLPAQVAPAASEDSQQLIQLARSILGEDGATDDVLAIDLVRPDGATGGGVGVVLTGGADYEVNQIKVNKVISHSLAHRDGRVQAGDRLLLINGQSCSNMTHRQALEVLKAPRPQVSLVLSRPSLAGQAQSSSSKPSFTLDDETERPLQTINVRVDKSGLGLTMDGGHSDTLTGRPLTIRRISKGAMSEPESADTDASCRLQIGDELISINATDCRQLSRLDCTKILKSLTEGNLATLTIRR